MLFHRQFKVYEFKTYQLLPSVIGGFKVCRIPLQACVCFVIVLQSRCLVFCCFCAQFFLGFSVCQFQKQFLGHMAVGRFRVTVSMILFGVW